MKHQIVSRPAQSSYAAVIALMSPIAREYVCYFESGELLISSSHRLKPEVTGFIAQLRRLQMPISERYVDLAKVAEGHASLAGSSQTEKASDMQRIAKRMFERAVLLRASDIHIRNTRLQNSSILMRVDGDLESVEEHPFALGAQICTAIYHSMTDISDPTFEVQSYQDARISDPSKLPAGVDGIRVATAPQVGGYVMVLRLLYNDLVNDFSLRVLGYTACQTSAIEQLKRRPTGINIIAGPTGSGKSTTLQRVLGDIIKVTGGRKNVITVEDPPEYTIPGAVQMPVSNADSSDERNEAFGDAIRAAMRLDPDIIMIGEVRDSASAHLAVQAAMTGHQVWTTLHANSALAIFDRLADLGIPKPLLTDPSIITGVTCQRLVKVLCPTCKVRLADVAADYSPADMRRVEAVVGDIGQVYVTGSGCDSDGCHQRGTIGRTVVAETVVTDRELMTHIRNDDRVSALEYWLHKLHGNTMLDHAIQLVCKGEIDPFEAEHVVGPIDSAISWKQSSDDACAIVNRAIAEASSHPVTS